MLEAQKRGRGRPKGAENKQKPARPRSVRPCVACVTPDSASNQESVFTNEFSALSLTSDASRRSQGESIVDSASTESGMPISQTDEPLVSKENREIRDTDSLDKNGSDDPVETVFGLESFRGCATAQDLKSKISELFSNSQDSLFEYLLVLQSRVFQLENSATPQMEKQPAKRSDTSIISESEDAIAWLVTVPIHILFKLDPFLKLSVSLFLAKQSP